MSAPLRLAPTTIPALYCRRTIPNHFRRRSPARVAAKDINAAPRYHALRSIGGIRVIEWGEVIAAPFCAKVLAELGADVIKVESPGGDRARAAGPFPGDVPHPERSGLFLFANLGETRGHAGYRRPTSVLNSSIVCWKARIFR